MPDVEEPVPKAVFDSLQKSGFPFQTAIAHVISCAGKRWEIHASEYPWRSLDNDDNFLDIAATNSEIVLTVECKKTTNVSYTFLLPLGRINTGYVPDFRCLYAEYLPHDPNPAAQSTLLNIWPQSPSSEFCVVSTASSNERLLERNASLLIRGTVSLAQDVQEHVKLNSKLGEKLPRAYLPIIVTNAKLFTARYEPTEISLDGGMFKKQPEDIAPAPWVRLSKPFIADRGRDFGHLSIFVVNATDLHEFLNLLELAPSQSSTNRIAVKLMEHVAIARAKANR